jgi:hypothetical protein
MLQSQGYYARPMKPIIKGNPASFHRGQIRMEADHEIKNSLQSAVLNISKF